ncbi:MAG: winged helix-turn-helix domain-containing protein [Nitrososphaera sp.]
MKDVQDDKDFLLKADKHIEVIGTEDERIKVIGEELANDTGRAIIGKLSQQIASTNDLAKSLDISLPLVNWHINRLLSVGLIKVEKIEMSSKNKEVKYYGQIKNALVIVPQGNLPNGDARSKKESVLLRLRHYLASIAAFVISGTTLYLAQENQAVTQVPEMSNMAKSVPHAADTLRSAVPDSPSISSVPMSATIPSSDPIIILTALVGAAIAFCAVFFGIKLYKKSKMKITK